MNCGVRWLVLLAGIGGLCLHGCDSVSDHERLQLMQQQVVTLNERVTTLQQEQLELKQSADAFRTIRLDPVTTYGFQRIDTDLGFFLVSLLEVVPHMDGYKLTMDIGNPSTAVYNGFQLTVKWGRRFEGRLDAYRGWHQALREHEYAFDTVLQPGTWNRVDVAIAPAQPEELGHLELQMNVSAVSFVGKE